jgi:hypothetical protein
MLVPSIIIINLDILLSIILILINFVIKLLNLESRVGEAALDSRASGPVI